jgi:hypothetical protein
VIAVGMGVSMDLYRGKHGIVQPSACVLVRVDMCHGSAAGGAVSNFAVFQCKEREIPAQSNVLTRMNTSPDLSHENRTGGNELASEGLHPASLAIAIAAIA